MVYKHFFSARDFLSDRTMYVWLLRPGTRHYYYHASKDLLRIFLVNNNIVGAAVVVK